MDEKVKSDQQAALVARGRLATAGDLMGCVLHCDGLVKLALTGRVSPKQGVALRAVRDRLAKAEELVRLLS